MRSLLLVLFLLCSAAGFSQISYENISFAEVLKEAGIKGKLIFLQFESATCTQCNEVANRSLNDKDLAEQLFQTFLFLKISPSHPDRNALSSDYNMQSGFGSLFINSEGTLIHKFLSTTSISKEYSKQIDIALQKAGESLKIDELEKEYKRGNKSLGFIENLLLKKKSLNLSTDILLNEYVELLPIDSQNTLRTLAFIAQMAPILRSTADSILRKDHNLFNLTWYSLPLSERIRINNATISKSLSKAIREKELAGAHFTAKFAQDTYLQNIVAGKRAYTANMLRYYEQTGDTLNYFTNAIDYYNRYYMSVSPDSIKLKDSLTIAKLLATAVPIKKEVIGNKIRQTTAIRFTSGTQTYSNALNYAASNFYKMTTQPRLLTIATEWIKKGLRFYESPEALNTYARLLYKQGYQATAIEVLVKAVELKKQKGYPVKDLETVLDKMKKKVVLED